MEVASVISPVQRQYRKLLCFERRHNLRHNSAKARNLYHWAELLVSLGHCPCRPDRLRCPCKEALEEIKTIGYCACKQFFR